MSDSSSLVVHLLDKEYRVGCPPEQRDGLIRAAAFLDDKLRETREANVIGLERIAIMAALNIAHELLLARGELDQHSRDSNRVAALINKVETELRACRKLAPVSDETV